MVDVVTYHNDIARTGQNLKETILTTANVNSGTFGKLRSLSVDGKVDAQPLYLSNLANIAGGTHNVIYVATEHGSVYAFDADSGTQLWKVTTLGSGESTSDQRGCDQVTPEIGVTATPVIDRNAGTHGVIYVVAMSKSGSTYFQRLHALDVTTGAEMFGGPKLIEASFPGTGDNSSNGRVIFDPAQYKDRAALLLLNGVVYITWASHCDIRPYTGWIMGYNQTTLAQIHCSQRGSQRQRRRYLDGRHRAGGGQCGKYLSSRRQRRFRYHARCQRISQQRQLWQCFPQDFDHGRIVGGGLLRDAQPADRE